MPLPQSPRVSKENVRYVYRWDELDPAPELAARIARSVDEAGEVLDSASPELAAIRKRLRTAQDRVRERLNAMLRSTAMAGLIAAAPVAASGNANNTAKILDLMKPPPAALALPCRRRKSTRCFDPPPRSTGDVHSCFAWHE